MTISRQEQLSEVREFIKEVDKEFTLILQRLHWDKETLLKEETMVTCKYDVNHRIPFKKQKEHEDKCALKSQDYREDDLYLPEPLDPAACTLVKLSSDDIKCIIDNASKCDPLFKKVNTFCLFNIGHTSLESQPLTADRLAVSYTPDERRAIHDAVVNTMPTFHDLSDLALPSSSTSGGGEKQKSRSEVLSELRDMKRRRARYRVPAAGSYSHALRGLIATQMELFTASIPAGEAEENSEKSTNYPCRDSNKRDESTPPESGEYKRFDKHHERVNDRRKTRDFSRDKELYNRKESRYDEEDKSTRYYKKHERQHDRERDRRYSTHKLEDRKRQHKDDYSHSHGFDRSSNSKHKHDRNKYNDESKKERHTERSPERSRSIKSHEKIEQNKSSNYDFRYEKKDKHRLNGNSSSIKRKDYK